MDEQTAIAAYTKAIKEAEKLGKENPGKAENPAEAIAFTEKTEKILDSVKTDGLPADLGYAFGAFRTTVKKMTGHVADMPIPMELLTDQAKLQAWLAQQAASDPKFLVEIQEKMGKFQRGVLAVRKESNISKAALDVIHKKYGIDVDIYTGKDGAKKSTPAAEKEGAEAEKETGLKKEAKPEKEKSKKG